MGSRIMHLVIANKIADCLSIKDKTSFLLGGIAPDAVSTKDQSHFFKGDHKDYSRYIDYKAFIHKYSSNKDSRFIQGYLTHLIADDIWLQGFYIPWLKNRMEADPDLFNLYHNDFRLLNGKLLEYYGFTKQLSEALSKSDSIIEIEEVKCKDIKEFIPLVIGDMDYDKGLLEQHLSVFTFEQIVGYIETSVDKGSLYIKSLNSLSY
ncbi:zinc dependent phospholipase C family protein [Paenibacillus piri]|uniref:Hydrolase n=1 Tax=Paenibacillus piri TaxID=2547395 RepID=A0A4R5K9V1_9BACL|nr:zinc dependent phospholipase C family protein [Paenibacillus piri]TDF90107.1 hydrolase [Paenibacillus piri]